MHGLLPEIAALLARGSLPPLRELQAAGPPMESVQALRVPGDAGASLAARLYRPFDMAPGAPFVVFFHGGGWRAGDLALYDAPCRALAQAMKAPLVAVSYRLAPRHPFPVPVLDAWAATRSLAQRAGAPVVVAGDSAGGALAAAVSLLARAEPRRIVRHQLLIYPPLDARMASPSWRAFAHSPFLPAALMREHYAAYAAHADPEDPLLSPLHAPDLDGLPPATLISADLDGVRDDAARYAGRLRAAGVEADLHVLPGVPHMALHFGGVSPACAAIPALAARALSSQASIERNPS